MLTPKFPYQKEERLSFLRGVLSVKRGKWRYRIENRDLSTRERERRGKSSCKGKKGEKKNGVKKEKS